MRLLFLILMMFAANVFADDGVTFYTSDATKAANLPFSDGVMVDDLFILSGALGTDPETGKMVPGGIVPQTHALFANIKRTLAANGLGLSDVVKCTVMMADIAEWPKFNEVYVTYFPGEKPARSAFAAAGLALDARLEMECWAYAGDDD